MSVVPVSISFSALLLAIVNSHRREQLAASDRVVHHCLVSGLFLALDGQQRIVADLGRRVARVVCVLQRNEALLSRGLFELLVVVALDEVVDAPLSQQIRLCLFGGAGLAIGGALVHPVDAVYPLLASRRLQLPLEIFLGAFLLDLVDALLGAFALGEGFLFFIVDGLLVSAQAGMEGFLQIQISATHGCDSLCGDGCLTVVKLVDESARCWRADMAV